MTHRVTIYWKCHANQVHLLQVCDRLPIRLSLNGEQYLEVDDKQLAHLKEYERDGLLEFRHKELVETPQGLWPASSDIRLSNGEHRSADR